MRNQLKFHIKKSNFMSMYSTVQFFREINFNSLEGMFNALFPAQMINDGVG